MDYTSKKGMAVLSMMLALILTIILVFAFLKAGTHLWRPDVDNSQLLETFVHNVNYLADIDEPDVTIPETLLDDFPSMLITQGYATSSVPLTIHEDELFLFFSGGSEDIHLSFNPTTTFQRSEELTSTLRDDNYFYTFLRPDVKQCTNRACVCYCDEGPYWTKIQEEPFVAPQKLIVGQSYMCSEPTCYSFKEENIVFGNRRGRANSNEKVKQDAYVNEILKLRTSSDKANEGFVAQSMDIVTLIQPALLDYFSSSDADNIFKDGKDLLFTLKDSRFKYNLKDQDKDIVEFVSSAMQWDGGVVIGGMGYAKNKAQARKRVLEGPSINMLFQKSLSVKEKSNELLAPLVIGVGQPVDPLNKQTTNDLLKEQQQLEYISSKKKSFDSLSYLVENQLLPSFSSKEEFTTIHIKLFNQFILHLEDSLDGTLSDSATRYASKRKEILSAQMGEGSHSFIYSQVHFVQKDSYVLANMSLCEGKKNPLDKRFVHHCFYSTTIDLPFTKLQKEILSNGDQKTFESVSSLTLTSGWVDYDENDVYFKYVQPEENYKEEFEKYALPLKREGDSFILSFALA
ncbi:MAG: hypothetical protein ACLFNM_00180 [Candidatus Woesearchaeota archaeon]